MGFHATTPANHRLLATENCPNWKLNKDECSFSDPPTNKPHGYDNKDYFLPVNHNLRHYQSLLTWHMSDRFP
jgi:hypothetical protein